MAGINLGIVFTAKDMASGVVTGLEKRFHGLDDTLKQNAAGFQKNVASFSVGMATMAAGAKIAAIPLSFVDAAGQFETSLTKMSSVTGIVGNDLDSLRTKALQLGVDTQFDPSQVVDGMTNLGTAGLKASQVLEAIQPTLLFSGASQGAINLDQASNTLVAATNAFGLSWKDAGHTVDVMTKVTQQGMLRFQDLEQVMASGGSVASATGQKFETFLATVSTIQAQGGTAINATEKFRGAMNSLLGASAPVTKGLKLMGMQMTDLRGPDGKFLQVPDLFDKIHDGLQKITGATVKATAVQRDKNLKDILGVDGMQAYNKVMAGRVELDTKQLQALKATKDPMLQGIGMHKEMGKWVLTGTDALRFNIAELKNSEKTAKTANDAYLKSYQGMQDLIKGSANTIKIVLGTPLLGFVGAVMNTILNGVLNPFLGWLQKTPGAAAAVSFSIFGLGAALMALGAGITVVSGLALAKTALSVLGITAESAMAAVGSAFSAVIGPLLLVTAAVAAFYFAYQYNLFGVRDATQSAVAWITTGFQGILAAVTGAPIGEALRRQLHVQGMEGFIANLQAIRKSVVDFGIGFMDAFNAASGGMPGILKSIDGPMRAIANTIKETVMQIIGIFQDLGIIQNMGGFDKATAAGNNFGTMLGSIVVPAAKLAANTILIIVSAVKTVVDVLRMIGPAGITAFALFMPGIGPVVAAAILIAVHWKTFLGILQGGAGIIGGIYGLLFDMGFAISAFFAGLPDAVSGQFMLMTAKAGAAWNGLVAGAQDALNWIVAGAFGAVMSIILYFAPLPGIVGGFFMGLWSMAVGAFMGMLGAGMAFCGMIISGVAGAVAGILGFFGGMVGGVIAFFSSAAAGALGALRGIPAGIGTIVSAIVSAFSGLAGALVGVFFAAGQALMGALSRGISAGIGTAVATARAGLAAIRGMLPFSDAKTGPLSDLTYSGSMLPKTWAEGIARTADVPVRMIEKNIMEPVREIVSPNYLTEGNYREPAPTRPVVQPNVNVAVAQPQAAAAEGSLLVQLMLDSRVIYEQLVATRKQELKRSYNV